MTKTIAQLWNGNLDPIGCFGKKNLEIKQLEDLIRRNLRKLEDNLTEKQKEIFEKYYDCINEYTLIISEQAFCDGFCMGTKLSVEALTGAEQIEYNMR